MVHNILAIVSEFELQTDANTNICDKVGLFPNYKCTDKNVCIFIMPSKILCTVNINYEGAILVNYKYSII